MRKRLFWLGFVALCLALAEARAAQTENHGIHAVPAPGKVAIDGKLDDWDLSGQVPICYDLESLRDVYSAQVAMMHDADSLYVALHWKDATPMGNSHDPRYQANKGWAGDCVQLRIKTDRIAHVDCWYSAPCQEPFIGIAYGKSLSEPFGGGEKKLFRTEGWKLSEGAEMAFLKDTDGKGYVQEIKLPWALITKERKYKAGDQLACGIELLWGEGDWPVHRYADNLAEGTTSREFFWTAMNAWGPVFLEPKGRLKLPTPPYLKALEQEVAQGPVEIRYRLPKEARVTLAIDDESGRRVRNLVAAQRRSKGRNVERWDGVDDEGKLVPPGKYTYKGIHHDGIHVNWVMSFASPGNPPWDTPDGRGAFYGDHSAAQAAAAAGDYVALACPIGEAGKHLIGCDLTGQRLWGLANRAFGDGHRISLATDGKILWVAIEGEKAFIYRVNIANGQYAPWNATAREANGTEYKILDLEVAKPPSKEERAKSGPNLRAIAYRDGLLAVCLTLDSKIQLRDCETGAVKAELAVPEPRAAVVDADGSLIVLSRDKLVRVARDGKIAPFCEGSFPDGYGLAIDPQRRVYLSVRGAEQNVKVFSPDGKLAGEIGTRGGRAAHGPFDDNAMRNPGQITVDSKGRLWVPEETTNPKRTSVWGLDGRLLMDFVGSTSYAGAGAINPADPTMAFADDTVYRIDLEKGTWRPVYSVARSDDPAALFPPRVTSRMRVITRFSPLRVYAYSSERTGTALCTMLRDGQWRAAAAVGVVQPKNDAEFPIQFEHPLMKDHVGQSYAWADTNGDGLTQPTELTFGPGDPKQRPFRHYYWGILPDTDGTLAFVGTDGQSLVKFPIRSYTACGAPVYDVTNPQIVQFQPKLDTGRSGEGHILGGIDGRVYLNRDPLCAVDKTGKILFTYPSRHVSVHGSHTAKAARPGYLIGPSSILGTADLGGAIGEIVDLNGNLGENYLFTWDGLWIQALFKDTRGWFEIPGQAVRGMSFDATTAGGESFGGNFVRTPDGKVYLTIGGTDARVLQVSGLDSIRRFDGMLTYTARQYAEAQRLATERAAKASEPKVAKIAKVAVPPKLDGKADDWPELLDESKPTILIQESAQRRYARVAARYDAENLYVAWRVFSPSGKIRNAGQDDRLLFKTGDCVDLMLGPEKSVPQREGNLRLLISTLGGQSVAVLYQKTVPGTPAKDRVPFSSPWRTIHFDRVTIAKTADVKIASAGIGGGYLVEAAIPWRLLGVQPQLLGNKLKLRGDFGVLYADSGGTTTVARHYWCNQATGLVNDVPGEADLTPNLWGDLQLE